MEKLAWDIDEALQKTFALIRYAEKLGYKVEIEKNSVNFKIPNIGDIK